MKKLCVIGNPIEHSLSPKIHNIWIKQNKLDFIYEKKLLEKEDLQKIIKELKMQNIMIKIFLRFRKLKFRPDQKI